MTLLYKYDQPHYYLLTISCQQKTDFIEVYQLKEVLMYLKLHVDSLHIRHQVYENTGKYHQLHYHAIVNTTPFFRYKQYTSFGCKNITGNTFSINWKPLYNYKQALEYIRKDLYLRDQQTILQDNNYMHQHAPNRFLTI